MERINDLASGEKVDKKKSNFEFLRILAMFMIVLHHFSVHSEWGFPLGITLPKFVVQLLSIGGKVGVNCFILISGYFLCKSSFKLKSLRNIWSNTLFYSILISLCFIFFDQAKINVVIIIRSLFPILTSTYWFITAYILLYLCVSFLNLLIENMDNKLYKRLLAGFFIIFSFIQNITQIDILGNNLLWFIFLYFLGGYIRLHFNNNLIQTNLYFGLSLFLILDLLFFLIFDFLSYYFPFLD
ncbi:MAG: acyltransferase [Staphylococcus equorum]|nr:acyltransferase [Staphylococcus equorum]